MGLKDTIVKATQAAFDATGNIAENTWYYGHASTRYDVSAGYTSVRAKGYMFSAIFTEYKKHGETSHPVDLMMLAPQQSIIFTPALHDKVVRIENETSVEYEVINFSQDPAGAHYKFELIKP